KALHGVAGGGTGQPAKWQTKRQPETLTQSGRENLLRHRPGGGSNRRQSAGRILSAIERSARRPGSQSGSGPKTGGAVLARNGSRHVLCRARAQEIPRSSDTNRTTPPAETSAKARLGSTDQDLSRDVGSVHGKQRCCF